MQLEDGTQAKDDSTHYHLLLLFQLRLLNHHVLCVRTMSCHLQISNITQHYLRLTLNTSSVCLILTD